MKVELDLARHAAVLRLIGALTADDGVPILKAQVQRLLDEGHPRLVVNLARTGLIDADGLGALVFAMVQASRAGGALRVVVPEHFQPTVPYPMSGFSTFQSEQDAIASLEMCETTDPPTGPDTDVATRADRGREVDESDLGPPASTKGLINRQLALEHQQRYRGPATRLVSPITSAAEANLVIRECSLALIVLGAIQLFLTIRFGRGSIGIGLLIMTAAFILRLRPGFSGAVVVVTVFLSIVLIQIWLIAAGQSAAILFPALLAVFVVRVVWAVRRLRTFKGNQLFPGASS